MLLEGRDVSVAGLPPGAAAFFLAALAEATPEPFLVIVPAEDLAATLASDLTLYSSREIRLLPDPGVLPRKPVSPTLEVSAARVRTLVSLGEDEAPICVASAAALQRRLSPPAELRAAIRRLVVGEPHEPTSLENLLIALGYERVAMVEGPAQFARRGSIMDIFPPGELQPYRLEFFGDVLESASMMDIWSQRRTVNVNKVSIFPTREVIVTVEGVKKIVAKVREHFGEDAAADVYESLDLYPYQQGIENFIPFIYDEPATVYEYFPKNPVLAIFDPGASAAAIRTPALAERTPADFPYPPLADILIPWEQLAGKPPGGKVKTVTVDPNAAVPADVCYRARDVEKFAGRVDLFVKKARAFNNFGKVVVVAERKETAQRLREAVALLDASFAFAMENAELRHGFLWPELGLALIPAWLVLKRKPAVPKRRKPPRFVPDEDVTPVRAPLDLAVGDLVVHADHGVGRFDGLVTARVEDHEEEFVALGYADGDRLYVPVGNVSVLYKYVGADPTTKPLDRLGGAEWPRARQRAKRTAEKMAKQLLELYAIRKARPGTSFAGDPAWEQELADTFPYVETPDQIRAIEAVAADMAAPKPMDRLVCGDVGFGKTEVAVRAALRAVADGAQVAVLVPTTILADQHYATFRERLAPFPVRVEMLSRFKTKTEQKKIVADLAAGKVDIVIGTHRLLSADVKFSSLGLLIIDEEQRFGVAQKEKIKHLRQTVDVLTLTATPIPRTLHMALGGLRDLSLIGTAPFNRLPIRTVVAPFDEELIADAIRRELARGGQVFFVHNRVQNIDAVAEYLADLVPEAKFGVAHGQMPERDLEKIMHRFADGNFSVLVSSAIIEAGLDFPNVNTLIVNRADTFGMSQLHQLRGRVGRSHVQAYAYFLTPPSHALTDAARRRLQAVAEASELGAGFQLAMRDLEIRGAGNILGPEQSGAVGAVGLDLYTELLAQAVAALRDEEPPTARDVPVRLDRDAFLPQDYVPEERLRLAIYRRLSDATTEKDVDDLAAELRDRFGPPPPAVTRLLNVRRLRVVAAPLNIISVEFKGSRSFLNFKREDFASVSRTAGPEGIKNVEVRPSREGITVIITADAEEDIITLTLKFVRALRD